MDPPVTLGKKTAFVFGFKYEKLSSYPKSGQTQDESEAKRQKPLTEVLESAKRRIAFGRYGDKCRAECPAVKKAAAGIVGENDVAVEIY